MAKYLVFSDSHGNNEKMLDIIRDRKEMEGVFFLGDIESGEERLRAATQRPVYMVRGNCDWSSHSPDFVTFTLHGHKLALVHGHRQHVNGGIDTLKYWALEKNADVVMYGHTHQPYVEQSSSMTILNPGSISRPRQSGHIPTYAVVDFCKNGEIQIEIIKC